MLRGLARRILRTARRIGRRGAFLLFLAVLDLFVALSLASPPPEVRGNPIYQFIAGVAPLPVWAGAWAAVGVTCLVQAFTRTDRIAYAAATALKVAWGAMYLSGWIAGALPRSWVGASVWLAFGAAVALIATWPEVPDIGRLTARDIMETTPDAIVTADAHGIVTSWNTAAERLFGWESAEIVGQSITVIVPHRLRARHQNGLDRVRKTGTSGLAGRLLEFTALHRDGTLIPVEITLGVWESKTGIAFTAAIRDVRVPQVEVKL